MFLISVVLECILCGFMCMIGIMEAVHLFCVFTDVSLKSGERIALCFMSVASILLLILIVRNRKFFREKIKLHKPIPAMLLFILLFILQIKYMWSQPIVQTAGDITLETVHSFLSENGIYTVSPLTGKPYSGAPLRYEILCLPTIYAWLCIWLRSEPELIVGRIVPTVMLCLCYMSYYLLAGTLFDREKDSEKKKWWFLVVIALIFFFCEQAVYMEGYGVLHAGHLGTTIRNSILIPLTLYAACEKKWLIALLCIFTELCIVWTFWGMGLCIVAALGVLSVKVLIYSRGWTNEGGQS